MVNAIFVPLVVLCLSTLYVYFSLKKAWEKIGSTDEASSPHSERAYKAFEFFFTITIAVVGGIGYLRLEAYKADALLARHAMIFLAGLQLFATAFVIIGVTSHLGSKWERWHHPSTKNWIKTQWWRMVEPWMILIAYAVGSFVWIAANVW
jgi:hypothetical protein